MPRSGVIIYLSPTTLELAVRSGSALRRVESADLDAADWPDAWSRQFRGLDGPLSQLIQRAGVRRGARADAVYQSPDTRVEFVTVQARARDAVAAARLALTQGGGDSTDRPSLARIVATENAGGAARTHVLSAGDSDVALDALAKWLARAGLVPGNLVPAEAAEMLGLAARFEARTPGEDPSLMLVGEHRTVLASGEGSSLRCVRTLDFGYGAMIDAIARGAGAGELRTLSPSALRHWAREALFRVGIPRRDQAVDESAGVLAEHVLPMLQPVLQRFAVEIKQTLRFTLGEAGLVRGSLLLTGPGAAIPNLAPVLSTQIDIPVTAAEGQDRSPLGAAANADLAALSLLPMSERRRRDGVAFKRVLLAGAGAAAVLIAADAARTFREQYDVERALSAQTPRLVEVRRDIELRRQAAELAERVEAQETAARVCLGARPDWAALMDELGALAAGQVRLTDVNASSAGASSAATISGVAPMADRASGAPDPLAAYIELLQKSPMIDGVELGSTRLGEFEGAPVKHFSVTARLVALPARLAGAEEKP